MSCKIKWKNEKGLIGLDNSGKHCFSQVLLKSKLSKKMRDEQTNTVLQIPVRSALSVYPASASSPSPQSQYWYKFSIPQNN